MNHAWPAVALLLAVAVGAAVLVQRRPWEGGANDETNSMELVPKEPAPMEQPAEPTEELPVIVKASEPQPSAVAKPKTAAPKSNPAVSEITPRKPTAVTPKPTPRKPAAVAPPRSSRKPAATKPERTAISTRKPAADAATASLQTEPTEPPAPKKPETAAAPAKPGVHYTVMAGSFTKSEMAFAEREHLSRLTNHPVWVSRRNIKGVRTYRIILGAFETTDIAQNVAQSLLHRGLIRDAKVLPLPLDP